jgi:O-antigen/teichoic acid export membrane protein
MARLAKNSASGAIYLIAQIIASFIVTPVIVHALGNAAYGAWEVALAIVSYVSLLELGFGQATLRGIALGLGRNDHKLIRETVSSAFAALTAMGLLGLGALLVASPWAVQILGTEQHPEIPSLLLVLIAAVLVLLQFLITALASIAGGMQEFVRLNLTRTLLLVTRAVVTLWTLHAGFGLRALAWIAIAFAALEILLLAYLFRVTLRQWLSVDYCSLEPVRLLAAFGLKSSLMQSASTVVRSIAPIAITQVIGPASIVYYSLANRLVEYGLSFTVSLGTPLMATYAEAAGANSGTLSVRWIETTRLLQFFSLGIPVGLFWFGPPFIGLWMGEDYEAGSELPMQILSVGLLAQGIATNCARVVTSQNEHGRLAAYAMSLALVVLPLAWSLTWKWGIAGTAVALCSYSCCLALIEARLAYRLLQLSAWQGLRQTSFTYVFALPALAAASWLSVSVGADHTYAKWIAGVMLSGAAYTVTCWFSAWTPRDRKRLLQLMQ